jgi:hypothetical protein
MTILKLEVAPLFVRLSCKYHARRNKHTVAMVNLLVHVGVVLLCNGRLSGLVIAKSGEISQSPAERSPVL